MTKRPYANIYDRHCSVKCFDIPRHICIGNNIIIVIVIVLVEDASVLVVIIRVTFKGERVNFPGLKIPLPFHFFFRMAREGRGNFPLSSLFLSPFSINLLFRFKSHRYPDSSHQSMLLALRYYQ